MSGLLFLKPNLYVCNVDEASIINGNIYTKNFIKKFGENNSIIISAEIENQLNSLNSEEKKIIWKCLVLKKLELKCLQEKVIIY